LSTTQNHQNNLPCPFQGLNLLSLPNSVNLKSIDVQLAVELWFSREIITPNSDPKIIFQTETCFMGKPWKTIFLDGYFVGFVG